MTASFSRAIHAPPSSKAEKVSRLLVWPLGLFIIAPELTYRLASPSQLAPPDEVGAALQAAGNYDYTIVVVRGAAYLIALAIFLNRLPDNLRTLSRAVPYLALTAFTLLSVAWSSAPLKVIVNFGHGVGMMLVALAAARFFRGRTHNLFLFLSILWAYPIVASLIAGVVLPGRSIDYDGRWVGILGNANSLGSASMLLIWASAAALYQRVRGVGRVLCWTLQILAWVALLLAVSRTSQAATLIIVATIGFGAFIHSGAAHIRHIKLAAAIFLVLVFGLALLILLPELLTWRGLLTAAGRSTDLSGRIALWESAFKLAEQRPWAGWSFDSNMSVLNQLHRVVSVTGQFHNGYLDLMVRGGIIGIVLTGIFLGQFLIWTLRTLPNDFRTAICYLALFAGILAHNFSEASLVRDSSFLWFALVLAYFELASRRAVVRRKVPSYAEPVHPSQSFRRGSL